MPVIEPIPALVYSDVPGADLSDRIAPPYDVLDARSKAALVARSANNISVVDLPHLPAKTVGPDSAYEGAGKQFAAWLSGGVLKPLDHPALFIYSQQYEHDGKTFDRRGLIANVRVQDFGPGPDGAGGVFPHEQTFSAAKEDRLKLMRATRAQLSPIFGLYSDPGQRVVEKMARLADREPDAMATTASDHVRHRIWLMHDEQTVSELQQMLRDRDVFIADGHHRYNTAINYRNEVGPGKGADACMFVLVAMQDPGMIVLPTHRLLGGMDGFSIDRLIELSGGKLKIEPWTAGGLPELEAALPMAGDHAIGLYAPAEPAGRQHWIATTTEPDPLAATYGGHSAAWRQLDVAIVQHLVVEGICRPGFARGDTIAWKFPHTLDELRDLADSSEYQLGIVMQPTPLDDVVAVSNANELMPQKSTFFYPKLATGLAINPLDRR